MRAAVLGAAVLAVLTFAAPAAAGCWATVGVSPPPADLRAGQAWPVDITVLQHGRNPLPDAAEARPAVTITKAGSGETKTFRAASIDPQAGVYRAEVVFPSGGSWSYQVYDGFDTADGQPVPCGSTHTFATLDVGGGSAAAEPGPPAGGSSGFPAWPVGGGIAGALAAAAAVAFLLRRRSPREAASA
jgi:hypothetical protein